MRLPRFLTLATTGLILAGLRPTAPRLDAQAPGPVALGGVVSSQAEGRMEGVLVTARREGARFSVTVVSDSQGRYGFPRTHLDAGTYAVRVRAVGYDLADPGPVTVKADTAGSVDLRLQPAKDLASQLSSLEWFTSLPGTPEQKRLLVRQSHSCVFCHTFERIARSRHTASEWPAVIQRMGTYNSDHSGLVRRQKFRPAAAVEGAAPPGPPARWGSAPVDQLAEYLASINLSRSQTWSYPLKTLARPKGAATRVIVTQYDPPRFPDTVIHDMDVDAKGNAWYGDTGWDVIGKLDPKTATFTEYPMPNFQPDPAETHGILDVQVDSDGNPWPAIRGSKLARFDVTNGKWTTFDLPKFERLGRYGVLFIAPFHGRNTDIVWANGTGGKIYRLDLRTGTADLTDVAEKMPGHGSYMVERDSRDNAYFTDPPGSSIGRIDAKTGELKLVKTPTPEAFPRRGYMDGQDRFWFSEFLVDKIGMFDTRTERFQEFTVPVEYITPYYARPDRNGDVWTSSQGSDRLLRLNPKTGETLQYLMPSYYDARKVVVDPSTDHVTVWLPNKNTGQIIRVQPLD